MRAKFKCTLTTTSEYNEQSKLTAICDDATEENKRFAKATPSGSLDITIDNPAARGFLVPGKSYYLDFTLA